MKTWEYIYIYIYRPDFNSFEYVIKSEIAGSHGNYIFNFLRNLHSVFQSGFTSLPSHHNVQRLHFSTSSPTFSLLFVMACPTGVRWHLIWVLIFISLWISDAENLFIALLAICMSSLEKCLFKIFAYFLNGLFVLLVFHY